MKTIEELEKIKTQLKTKYSKVYEVIVPLDEDDVNKTATIFLRKPDKTTRSIVGKLIQSDPIKAVEAALKNIYIGGDDLNEVLNYEDTIPSIEEVIVELLTVQKATLKKNV